MFRGNFDPSTLSADVVFIFRKVRLALQVTQPFCHYFIGWGGLNGFSPTSREQREEGEGEADDDDFHGILLAEMSIRWGGSIPECAGRVKCMPAGRVVLSLLATFQNLPIVCSLKKGGFVLSQCECSSRILSLAKL